ncbi:uncharacterized protein LOC131306934 [Rhododendron vialii]|uniref:uncharacterized protein LOC131306934 n=1 Tax=Rhododendron vialii TaxID=182163 RepID=UPI00265E3144|nr:uncharacterized protein LOC131306934 [Rhododendron vialii]
MPMVDDVCVHVYSPSTNTWRHLNSYLSPECLRRCFGIGAYSDGVYYWWAGTGVLAFDMGNEVFRVISVPFILPSGVDKCDVKPYNADRIALYQFKGFPESGIDDCCDIWVMEEEGSWIKHFSVGPIPCRAFQQGFWKNGKLVFLKLILGWVFQLTCCDFPLIGLQSVPISVSIDVFAYTRLIMFLGITALFPKSKPCKIE